MAILAVETASDSSEWFAIYVGPAPSSLVVVLALVLVTARLKIPCNWAIALSVEDNAMNRESWFLVIAAVGLTPIALAYGAVPSVSVPMLYGVEAGDVSWTHIFRAVMGLYLAMAAFWLIGAVRDNLTLPALYSLTVFMLGLAAGRAFSLLVDGMPSILLVLYLVLEIVLGVIGLILVRGYSERTA